MPAVRNKAWYDLNSARAYPIDERATAIDDNGQHLPSHILADLHLVAPDSVGQYAFISAVTVRPAVVSVTLLASDSPTGASGFVPLAAITLPQPVEPFRAYPLEPLYPGVFGVLAFGSGVGDDAYTARFSSPEQTLLAPKAAVFRPALPIPSVAKLHNGTPLTGLVSLLAGPDLEIVKACREIPGHPATASLACDEDTPTHREVIVIRLADTTTNGPTRNVFEIYAGPCGARPESGTCKDDPIVSIASVLPDCCGNITLELQGCATLTHIIGASVTDELGDEVVSDAACGVVVDCNLGLADACVSTAHLPTAEGVLPNEYADLCVSQTSIVVDDEPEESFTEVSDPSPYINPGLPRETNFSVNDGMWVTALGLVDYDSLGGAQALTTEHGLSTHNVAYWTTPGQGSAAYTYARANLKLRPGNTSTLRNASVIANYQVGGAQPEAHWAAEVEYDNCGGSQRLRLTQRDLAGVIELDSLQVPWLALETAYQLELRIYPHISDSTRVWVYAMLTALEGGPNQVHLGPTLATNIATPGYWGIATNRATSQFNYFRVANIGG